MQTKTIPNEELIPEIGKLIQEGTDVVFRPKGMSMLPFIKGGKDSVLLRKPEYLNRGDVVLAKTSSGDFVLHRIESMIGNVIILMGDGNLAGRERCTSADVIAVVVKIIRGDSEIDCKSVRYMRRVQVWKNLLPVRRYLLAIYKRIIL